MGIAPNPKNFKRQSLTGKVLPDFKNKGLMEPIQKKGSRCPALLVVQIKDWQLVFIFYLQGLGVSSFIDKSNPDHKPNCICTKHSLNLSLPALNPGTHTFSLLINVFCDIVFFQNRAHLSH